MNIIELAKEADIYVAHLNKPMTDKEVRLAFLERFATLVRAEYEKPLKLAEEALERLEHIDGVYSWAHVLDAIRETLAEPDIEEMTLTQIASRHEPVTQEPVAWRYNSNGDWIYKDRKVWDAAEPLYAAPVQTVKHEPVITEEMKEMLKDGYSACAVAMFFGGKVGSVEYGKLHNSLEMLAQPVKQEPVAWMWVCVDVESRSIETGLLFNRGADDENTDWTPLYAAPVSAEAIRAEALEEAAKVAETFEPIERCSYVTYASDAIRVLK